MINGKATAISIVHPDAMSIANRHLMATLLARDPEAWASLSGAMAVLALPVRQGSLRPPAIEVEIVTDQWVRVHELSISVHGIVFASGTHPARVEWQFPWAGGVPRWRMPLGDVGPSPAFIEDK